VRSKLNRLLVKLGMLLVCGTILQPAAALGQAGDTAKVAALIEKLSNWGRWGADDQLGTLNLITPEVRIKAAKQVREGISVSMAAIFSKWCRNHLVTPPVRSLTSSIE